MERRFILTEKDVELLVKSDIISELFRPFLILGDVEFLFEGEELIIFGMQCSVMTAADIFLKKFFFEFPMNRYVISDSFFNVSTFHFKSAV